MISVTKEIKVMEQRVMGASAPRKRLFKETPLGRDLAGEDSAMCGVRGEPGEEPPRQRGRQGQKLGLPEAQEQGRTECLGLGEQGRSGADRAGLWLGLRSLGSPWTT